MMKCNLPPLNNLRQVVGKLLSVPTTSTLLISAVLLMIASTCTTHAELSPANAGNRKHYPRTPHHHHRATPAFSFASKTTRSWTSRQLLVLDIPERRPRSPLLPASAWNRGLVGNKDGGGTLVTTTTSATTTTRLYALRPSQDNLVGGIAQISFGFCLGVFFSEYAIIQTGCGPSDLSDTLERICYQGVIVSAGIALFNRIVNRTDMAVTCENLFGPLDSFTLWQVRVVESMSALVVLGAFVSLAVQYGHGTVMDGLSGIDVSMCRAIRDL